MGNIFTSSIGKKLIMSITGAFLVLFLTFHMLMNAALIFSDDAYNAICAFLGANWYAIAGTVVLTVGVLLHFIYAIILTAQNMKARGRQRYAVSKRQKGVDWASKNMLVLGVIVVIGLCLHLYNFWANMQLTELAGDHINQFGQNPQNGAWLVRHHFSNVWYLVVYLVWFVAMWFHLTHGFWSMFQTVGWNSKVWMKRMKCISYVIATLIMGAFALIAVVIFVQERFL